MEKRKERAFFDLFHQFHLNMTYKFTSANNNDDNAIANDRYYSNSSDKSALVQKWEKKTRTVSSLVNSLNHRHWLYRVFKCTANVCNKAWSSLRHSMQFEWYSVCVCIWIACGFTPFFFDLFHLSLSLFLSSIFFLSFTLYFCHWHGDSSRVDELLKLLRLSRNKCISYKVYYVMCIAVFSLSLSLSIDSIHLPHVCPPHKFYFVVSTKSHRYLCPCTIRCMCMCIPSVSTLYPFISSPIHSICLSVCHQHS